MPHFMVRWSRSPARPGAAVANLAGIDDWAAVDASTAAMGVRYVSSWYHSDLSGHAIVEAADLATATALALLWDEEAVVDEVFDRETALAVAKQVAANRRRAGE